MKIPRRYTTEGQSPYHGIEFDLRTSEIKNPDGSTVFRQDGIAVPSAWSAVATDILAQKYFRKAGVPQVGPDGKPLLDKDGRPVLGRRARRPAGLPPARRLVDPLGRAPRLLRQAFRRPAFYDELCHMLAAQVAAPNSPQWFNTGLHFAYGLTGPAQGHYYVDPATGVLTRATSAYERPAAQRLLHPVRDGRSRQRRRDHGPLDARGASLQVRLGHGVQFLRPPRRERAAVRRRQVLRADVASSRSETGPRAPSSRAARPGGRPRWSSSISTILTWWSSSTGRWSRSRR